MCGSVRGRQPVKGWRSTLRKVTGVLFIVGCFFLLLLTSCQTEKQSGLGQHVTVENLDVSIVDVFGNENQAYIIAVATLPSTESVQAAELESVLVDCHGVEGSYSFYCIGRNEETHTQTYLISLKSESGSLCNKKVNVSFTNFSSLENPMYRLIHGEWTFSFRLQYDPAEQQVFLFHDGTIQEIFLYDRAIILCPANHTSFDQMKAQPIIFENADGVSITPQVSSQYEEKCYYESLIFLFSETTHASSVEKVLLGGCEYTISGS